MTAGRTSAAPNQTSTAVPTDRTEETQNIPDRLQPSTSTRIPPRNGPTAKPIGPATPNSAINVPIRRVGTTPRIAAGIPPVLPSWNPISRRLTASCHGSRDNATQANTTASTSALRATTALREYLTAETTQSGTRGLRT